MLISFSFLFLPKILEHAASGNGGGPTKGAVNLDLINPGGRDDATTYFKDGVRKIDFVMVYEERGTVEENTLPVTDPQQQQQQPKK